MTVDVGLVLGLLAQLAVVIGALAAGVVWLRKWLRKQVSEPLATVQHEVKPNQGDTLKDAIDRTETKLDRLIRSFEEHLRFDHRRVGRRL